MTKDSLFRAPFSTWSVARLALLLLSSALAVVRVQAEMVINEVLFNPPGGDSPNEYIELRGTPNLTIPAGTYFVAVEGNAGANPGTIQNVFDLSGQNIGGNGFLVLLQAGSPYDPHPFSKVLRNTGSGAGWGSGADSTVGHSGNNGRTDLINPSVTFMLVQTAKPPVPGEDIDSDDDGTPDGSTYGGWVILDSVGILDADGAGDIAYGKINFRRNTAPGSGALAGGTIIPVPFTAGYVGRAANTSGWAPGDWIASDALTGSAPGWYLGPDASTYPPAFSGARLAHLGGPNFGAPLIPGIVDIESAGLAGLSEGGPASPCSLALTVEPAGPVTIQINCGPDLELCAGTEGNYARQAVVTLTNTAPQEVLVRAVPNIVLDTSPHWRMITNVVTQTQDPVKYPLGTLAPQVRVGILESGRIWLSEIKVNPPGPEDAPYEYIELAGQPGLLLTNVCLLGLDANSSGDPGKVTYALDLTGVIIGPDGLLAITASNSSYAIPQSTTVIQDPQLSVTGGGLGNGSLSVLLVSTHSPPRLGTDLDKGDNGLLEGMPADATILDSVGWSDGDKGDLVYSPADLSGGVAAPPDAVVRLPGHTETNVASAWFFGDLQGPNPGSLAFEPTRVSPNFPSGTLLTPGAANTTAPGFSQVKAISGVIGDATNPAIEFTVSDAETPAGQLMVTASSSNPAVVPATNLTLSALSPGVWRLGVTPVGVGYAELNLEVTDGSMTGRVAVPYAASAPGRPGGVWHLGASDGSTAIPVDADWMFIGDDENQTLRLYSRRLSGPPVWQADMGGYLGLPDLASGLPREVDVEASTRIGGRIFWMGSHGHGAEGESRTNRTRVFATDIVGSGADATLRYVGRYDYLKLDLIRWDTGNLHGKGTNYYGLEASDSDGVPPKAPDGSGLSIEGLSVIPGSTNGAFVAFRAPVVPATNRTYALVVPVLNLAEVVATSGPPGSLVFGEPIELDLYGRGIRSMESDASGLVIIGGSVEAVPGRYPRDFRLYTWSGNPAEVPQQRLADLSGLNPEGLVGVPPRPWTADSPVELVSDNGTTVFYGDGVPAKRLTIENFKKCRSDVVPLGQPTKPAPIVTSVLAGSGRLLVTWRALKGETYTVQVSDTADGVKWRDFGSVLALGPYASAEVDLGGLRQFYRVAVRDY